MATSTVRFAIIVALVVGGVVLISKAFPSGGGASVPSGGGGPTTTASPTPKATKTPKPPLAADLEGVQIAVLNGTSVTGLAGDTAATLVERFGVVVPDNQIADAPSRVATTTLYYRGDQGNVNAQELVDKFFAELGVDAKLAPIKPDLGVDKDTQIAIVLGDDYANAA